MHATEDVGESAATRTFCDIITVPSAGTFIGFRFLPTSSSHKNSTEVACEVSNTRTFSQRMQGVTDDAGAGTYVLRRQINFRPSAGLETWWTRRSS